MNSSPPTHFFHVLEEILPHNYFAVLFGFMGDMEFFPKWLGHEAPGQQHPLLPLWREQDPKDKPWNDFVSNAMWRTSRSLRQRNPAHPIFKAPGVSIYTLCLDILHVLDLGFSSHCIGNVCFDFVVCKVPAAQRQLALKKLWAYIQEHQGEAGHGKPLSKFTLDNFTKPKALSTTYPCLAHLKAAQDPWHHKGSLFPPSLRIKIGSKVRLWCQCFPSRDWCDGSTYSLKRKDLLAHLDMYYNHVYDSGLVPEKQEARAALGHMEAALQTYQFLAAKAVKEKTCQWSMVPKLHYCNELFKA